VRYRILITAVILSAASLPGSGLAQNAIIRSSLLSGGGSVTGTSVSIRAGFGEPFGSVPGAGANIIRTGLWLRSPSSTSAVDDIPLQFGLNFLGRNYPNPFNPRTVIPFSIARSGQHVRLNIYDLAGRRIRTLVDGLLPAGPQEIVWDGTDSQNRTVPSGVYFYSLETTGFLSRQKFVLIR